MSGRKIFKAVAIITVFSILTRALGFLFRIFLSRALGAELLGEYQVAMSVFGVLLTLICSGLPLVVSRSVASKRADNDLEGEYKVVGAGLCISLAITIIVTLVILIIPNAITALFSNNISSTMLFLLLPALISSSLYSIFRGAMWGQKRFFAISFTELFEQVLRMILCAILLSVGITSLSLPELAGLSLSLACIGSAILATIIYFAVGGKVKQPKFFIKPLLKTSTPITAVRTISSLVQSFIALIIPIRLMAAGLTQGEALAEFGIATGMTLPLLMVPCTLISSIAVAFVPEISGQTDNIDKQPPRELAKLKTHINLCVNVSIVIAFILFPAFAAIGMPIGEALFHNEKAGYYLMLSAIVMLPICLSQITSSILNSLGLEMKSLINYAIGAILLFLSIFFLPKWIGAVSLIVGLGSLYFVTTILNLVMLHKRNLLSFTYVKNILLLLVVSIPCILFTKWFYQILSHYMSLFISTAIAGAVSVGLFVSICAIFNLANFRIILFRKRKVAKATA